MRVVLKGFKIVHEGFRVVLGGSRETLEGFMGSTGAHRLRQRPLPRTLLTRPRLSLACIERWDKAEVGVWELVTRYIHNVIAHLSTAIRPGVSLPQGSGFNLGLVPCSPPAGINPKPVTHNPQPVTPPPSLTPSPPWRRDCVTRRTVKRGIYVFFVCV